MEVRGNPRLGDWVSKKLREVCELRIGLRFSADGVARTIYVQNFSSRFEETRRMLRRI